jgi:starvation-inducible DNA-binding protein
MVTLKMSIPRIELRLDTHREMIALLNQQLADTFDLYSQTKQMHQKVKGPHFHQLHELFNKLAGKLADFLDLIAERVTALGGTATARMTSSASRLPEFPPEAIDSLLYLQALATRYGSLAASTRAAIETAAQNGDIGTSDLLTEVSRELDKTLWFLEGYLHR